MKITLTQEERLKLLHAAFCGAGHIHYGAMIIDVRSNDDYDVARESVSQKLGDQHLICREEVWLEAFNLGLPIRIIDVEDDQVHLITEERLANLDNLPHNIIVKILDDDGDYDADDLDWVLEFIMFNDKIYG